MTNIDGIGEQRFREHISLDIAGFKAEFFVNDLGQHVAIIREHTEGDIRLFVREARALYEWLGKVLP
jgi:hypothetical protein